MARKLTQEEFLNKYANDNGISRQNLTGSLYGEALAAFNSYDGNYKENSFSYGDDITKTLFSGMKNEDLTLDANKLYKSIINPEEIFKEIPVIYQEKTIKLFDLVNQKLGMSGELASDFRNEIRLAAPDTELLGVGFDALLKGVEDVVKSSGKFKILDRQSMLNMADASRFVEGGIEGFAKLASETEKYSLGVNDTAREVTKMMKDSIELGLNYKKVIDGVSGSLEKLNMYGFKNGIQGLGEMSRKAIEYRMNLESTFAIADKVWDPQGAVDMVANLQMIGGALGDLNDPIKLMYMATNNVEGLQDSLIDATKSLATYNQELGVFEVTGANLRRSKDMAAAMGVTMQELGKISIAAAERYQASTEIMSTGLQMKDEDKEFLTNMARMEDGRMVISIPENLRDKFTTIEEGQVELSNMTSDQMNEILKYRKEIQGMSTEEIGRQQVDIQTNILRGLSFLVAKAQFELGKTGDRAGKEVLDMFGLDRNNIATGVYDLVKSAGVGMEGLTKNLEKFIFPQKVTRNTNLEDSKYETKRDLGLENKTNLNNNTKNIEKTENVTTVNENITLTIKSGSAFTDPIEREWIRMSQLDPRSFLNKN
jgi:hypothetical protein